MSDEKIIHLEGVSVFQRNVLVLSDVTFTLQKGEFVYLIGKTGSGKSSLLKTLYADLPVTQGVVQIGEMDMVALKRKQIPFLRRKLGIVFQDFQLLMDRTIFENLRFVLRATGWSDKDGIKNKIEDVLDKVGLKTKGFKMPHQLSGGEQQRVAIARALLNDPELILADEPTGNLDPETSEGIMQLLISLSRDGRTVLMATHNHALIQKYPSRILRCEGGKVLSEEISV